MYAMIGIFIVMIAAGAWFASRGSFNRPESMAGAIKRAALLAVFLFLMISTRGILDIEAPNALPWWGNLAIALLFVPFSAGLNWLRLRHEWAAQGA